MASSFSGPLFGCSCLNFPEKPEQQSRFNNKHCYYLSRRPRRFAIKGVAHTSAPNTEKALSASSSQLPDTFKASCAPYAKEIGEAARQLLADLAGNLLESPQSCQNGPRLLHRTVRKIMLDFACWLNRPWPRTIGDQNRFDQSSLMATYVQPSLTQLKKTVHKSRKLSSTSLLRASSKHAAIYPRSLLPVGNQSVLTGRTVLAALAELSLAVSAFWKCILLA